MAEWCIGVDSLATRFAEPVPFRDFAYVVALLVHGEVAPITEEDLVRVEGGTFVTHGTTCEIGNVLFLKCQIDVR